MILGNSIGGFPSSGGGGGGGGLSVPQVNDLIQQAIATWGNIDLWDMSVRSGSEVVVIPQAAVGGALSNTSDTNYTFTPGSLLNIGPYFYGTVSSTTMGFLKSDTNTMAGRIKLPSFDGTPETSTLVLIFIFIRDINNTVDDCINKLVYGTGTVNSSLIQLAFGVDGSTPIIGASCNNFNNGAMVSNSTGPGITPNFGTDNLYFEFNPSTGDFGLSTDSTSVPQFNLPISTYAPSESLGIDIMFVALSNPMVLQEPNIEFELGTLNGGRTPFKSSISGDSILPTDAQEGKEYICSGVGVYNTKSPEIGDLVKIIDGLDIYYIKNPNNIVIPPPFDDTIVKNYETVNLFSSVTPVRLYADTELQVNSSITNDVNELNGFRMTGNGAFTSTPGYTRTQVRMTPFGKHDMRLSFDSSTDPLTSILGSKMGILLCSKNIEDSYLVDAFNRENIELAHQGETIGDYIKLEFTITRGYEPVPPFFISVNASSSVSAIARVNGIQKRLENTTNAIFDPLFAGGSGHNNIRFDFDNGEIIITDKFNQNPENNLGAYRFPFNNRIFNNDVYDDLNKFCDSIRVYFYYYSDSAPNSIVPVKIVPSYNFYGYGSRNIPEFDPTSWITGKPYLASGYGSYNNKIVEDGDVFRVLESVIDPLEFEVVKPQLSLKELTGMIQDKIDQNNTDNMKAMERFRELGEIVLCQSNGLDQADACLQQISSGTGILLNQITTTNIGTYNAGSVCVLTENKELMLVQDFDQMAFINRQYKLIGFIDTDRNYTSSTGVSAILKRTVAAATPSDIRPTGTASILETSLPDQWYFDNQLPEIYDRVYRTYTSGQNTSFNPTIANIHEITIGPGDYSLDRTITLFVDSPNPDVTTTGKIRVKALPETHIGEHFRINVSGVTNLFETLYEGSILELEYYYKTTTSGDYGPVNEFSITNTNYISNGLRLSKVRQIVVSGAGDYEVRDILSDTVILVTNSTPAETGQVNIKLMNALQGARVKIKIVDAIIDGKISIAVFPSSGAVTYSDIVASVSAGSTYEFVHLNHGAWTSLT